MARSEDLPTPEPAKRPMRCGSVPLVRNALAFGYISMSEACTIDESMYCPTPSRARRCSDDTMDSAPSMPTATSMTGKPTFSGGASGLSPDIIIMPVSACTTWS